MPKSVMDLILPLTLSFLLWLAGELFPRIRLALLHAQRNAAALGVDVEDHHLDLVAQLHHLGRVDVLVGPVHFGNVHQAFHARLDFHERAVVGDVGDLAEQARAFRITALDVDPWIVAELLQAERDAVAFAVVAQHLGFDLVADLEHFARMLDALPRQVGDVQQAVDAAEVDERAVIGEVLDHALDGLAFFQTREQRLALGGDFLLHHGAARHDHVVALAVDLDDLEFEFLAFEVARIAHGADIDKRTREKGADGVHGDGVAALHLAGHDAGDDGLHFECLLEIFPGLGAAGLLARQAGLAGPVFEHFNHDFHDVADLDGHFTAGVLELGHGDHGFGLESGVDDDDVFIHVHDFAGDQRAGLQVDFIQAFFK